MDDLTLEHARSLIAAALTAATEQGWLVSTVVIDRHGT